MKGTPHPLLSSQSRPVPTTASPRGCGAAHSPRPRPAPRHLELVRTRVPPRPLTCRRWTWDPRPRGVAAPEPPTRTPLCPNGVAPCPALAPAGPEGAAGCSHEVWPGATPRERGLSRGCVLGSSRVDSRFTRSTPQRRFRPFSGGGPESGEAPGPPCARTA